jgi:(4-(4-[2-(gamma-L-glutamylamino)ethyl]phenoxymethyl)furan-2-yl)methanamine synthase
VQIAGLDRSGMQCRGDERPCSPGSAESEEIVDIAHAPRRVDLAVGAGQRRDLGEAREVRPLPAADARERHDDGPVRPRLGLRQEGRRPEERLAAEIERKGKAAGIGGHKSGEPIRGPPRLRADDRDDTLVREKPASIFGAAKAGIDPELQAGERLRQAQDRGGIGLGTGNAVEIGDVELPEREELQQATHDGDGVAPDGERRRDRPIGRAIAAGGAHHASGADVDDGDDLHAACLASTVVYHGPFVDEPTPAGGKAMTITAGLDVGGAHLKVALAGDGRIVAVRQIACPLWQGFDQLEAALAAAAPLTGAASRHAVTMTGELSDLFTDRAAGVEALVDRLTDAFGPGTRFWMGRRGFGSAEEACRYHVDVGSTNFLATATLVGQHTRAALVIDMGSTTVDIVPVAEGRPVPRGLTDADRLASGELVYTGLTRTSVMAIASEAPFQGRWQRLVREHYANAADLRRVLGTLPEGVDQHATADGRGKSVPESVARLARMFGRDAAEGSLEDWRAAARFIEEQQVATIVEGALQVLSGTPLPEGSPVVAAGIGAERIADGASRLGRPWMAFGDLIAATEDCRAWATRCAPAVAVGLLCAN